MRILRTLALVVIFLSAMTMHAQNDATPPPVAQSQPETPKVVRISSAVMDKQVLKKVAPNVLRNHPSGGVVLHVVIGADGSVKTAEAVHGPIQLYAAAVEAVRQWKYRPYVLNGEPVEVDTTVVINFG